MREAEQKSKWEKNLVAVGEGGDYSMLYGVDPKFSLVFSSSLRSAIPYCTRCTLPVATASHGSTSSGVESKRLVKIRHQSTTVLLYFVIVVICLQETSGDTPSTAGNYPLVLICPGVQSLALRSIQERKSKRGLNDVENL